MIEKEKEHQVMLKKQENGKKALLLQFVKFGLVGISNTAISYGIDMLFYYIILKDSRFAGIVTFFAGFGIQISGERVKVILITALAFVISVTNSYYWNSRFVFKEENKKTRKQHLDSFLRMALCYALTGLVLSPMVKIFLFERGMPYWIAGAVTIMIMVPVSFFLNKFWAFKGREMNVDE